MSASGIGRGRALLQQRKLRESPVLIRAGYGRRATKIVMLAGLAGRSPKEPNAAPHGVRRVFVRIDCGTAHFLRDGMPSQQSDGEDAMTTSYSLLNNETGEKVDLPLVKGTLGAGWRRCRQGLRQDGSVHLRSRLHVDLLVQERDHLHRWRPGRAAVSRLSGRPAGESLLVHRSRLPDPARRAAEQDRARRVRRIDPSPHDDQRVAAELLQGLQLRRAPDGNAHRHRRFAVGVLSRHHQQQGSEAPRDLCPPDDREDPDDRGRRVQESTSASRSCTRRTRSITARTCCT